METTDSHRFSIIVAEEDEAGLGASVADSEDVASVETDEDAVVAVVEENSAAANEAASAEDGVAASNKSIISTTSSIRGALGCGSDDDELNSRDSFVVSFPLFYHHRFGI